eukprot:scaffold123048_cov48-Phaeocystis_antarctica.AAC.1
MSPAPGQPAPYFSTGGFILVSNYCRLLSSWDVVAGDQTEKYAEIGTTIKPDGGCIKHDNSQTIDKRIQFGRNSPVRVRVRILGALYLHTVHVVQNTVVLAPETS